MQARLAHVQAIVSLYQALGGGWLPKPSGSRRCTVNCPSRLERADDAARPRAAADRHRAGADRGRRARSYYVFYPRRAATAAAARPLRRRRPGAGAGGAGRARRRAGLSRRGRHRQGAQHRDRAPAGRRQAARRSASRKARTSRKATCWRASIRPPTRRSSTRRVAKKAQDEAQLANAKIDLDALREARRHQRHQQAAGRHPARAGRAIHRAGAVRPGRHRQRAGDARLHHHHRADRRPHRHPHGRRRQYRARLRRQFGDRRHHADPADLGACSACRSRTCRASTTPSPRVRWQVDAQRSDNDAVIDTRQAHRGRQPGRSVDRHGEAQGRIPQRQTCSSGPASSSTCGC